MYSELLFSKGKGASLRYQFTDKDGKQTASALLSEANRANIDVMVTILGLEVDSTVKDARARIKKHLESNPALIGQTLRPRQAAVCCSVPGCSNHVTISGAFCKKARGHNRFEFLRLKAIQFTFDGDRFGAWLATSILTDMLSKKLNPLQPSLTNPPRNLVPQFAMTSAMLDFFLPYLDVLQASLGITQKINAKVVDQADRSDWLKNLLRDSHDTVRLMDGRCGLLLVFLKRVRDEYGAARLNSLRIELVDIDPRVTAWHSFMYKCPKMVCLTENIISLHRGAPRSALLYLNFCGIAESFPLVLDYLTKFKTECVISFSVARSASKKNYEQTLVTFLADLGMAGTKLPSARGDFVTYTVGFEDRVNTGH